MLDILLCGNILGVLNTLLHVTEKKEKKAPE